MISQKKKICWTNFFFETCFFLLLFFSILLNLWGYSFLFPLQSIFLLDAQWSAPEFGWTRKCMVAGRSCRGVSRAQVMTCGCPVFPWTPHSCQQRDVRPMASYNTYHVGLENYLKFIVRNSINFTRHIYSVFKTLTTLLTRVFCWKLEGWNGMLAFWAKCEKLFK